MAFTTADVAALERAMATGANKVRFADGREVTYRSLDEMRRILAMAQADVAGTSGRQHSVAGF